MSDQGSGIGGIDPGQGAAFIAELRVGLSASEIQWGGHGGLPCSDLNFRRYSADICAARMLSGLSELPAQGARSKRGGCDEE